MFHILNNYVPYLEELVNIAMKNKHGPVFHILNLWISRALCFIFWTCKLCYKESAGPCVSYLELVNFATKNKQGPVFHILNFWTLQQRISRALCFISWTFELCKQGPVFHILNFWTLQQRISRALCFISWTCEFCYKE